ncbi:MFS transporter [candidate division WOR-3 bacterium]|nr:MFS transporter [candidate division WOR-3 bacterium]
MWATLRDRNFSIFTFSQTISQFGDKLDYIALIGLIGLFSEQQTPFLLSLLAIFITLPVLIFGPVAGVLVDRWHKKKVMVICDILRMLCAGGIPVVFLITRSIYVVFALVFFMFLVTLFFNAARSAIIPNLVGKEDILKANSMVNFVSRGATVLGMWLGGLIVDWGIWPRLIGIAGWTVAFVLDALTFGVSAIMLYIMKVELVKPPRAERHLEARGLVLVFRSSLVRIWQELKHAIGVIIREPRIRFAMISILFLVIAAGMIYVLVIPIVQKEMAWGTSGVGNLAAIGAFGLLGGSWLVGVFGHRVDIRNIMIICSVILGAILIVFPFLSRFWMFAIATFVGGIAISPLFIGQDTLIHTYAHEFVRGRMFSIRDWILSGSFVIVALVIGSLTAVATKSTLFIVTGILLASFSILSWMLFVYAKKSDSVSPHNA